MTELAFDAVLDGFFTATVGLVLANERELYPVPFLDQISGVLGESPTRVQRG